MKNLKLAIILLLLFLCRSEVYGNESTSPDQIQSDSLVLENNNSSNRFVILPGQKIKIQQQDKSKVVGHFLSIYESTLTLQTNQGEAKIWISDLKSIKIYSAPIGQFVGKAMVIIGAGGMVFGGISLVAGLAALSSDSLGAIILVAVPVLAGGGYGVYSLGNRLTGKKFDLTKKWSLSSTL